MGKVFLWGNVLKLIVVIIAQFGEYASFFSLLACNCTKGFHCEYVLKLITL
jgi:hypothetical protein